MEDSPVKQADNLTDIASTAGITPPQFAQQVLFDPEELEPGETHLLIDDLAAREAKVAALLTPSVTGVATPQLTQGELFDKERLAPGRLINRDESESGKVPEPQNLTAENPATQSSWRSAILRLFGADYSDPPVTTFLKFYDTLPPFWKTQLDQITDGIYAFLINADRSELDFYDPIISAWGDIASEVIDASNFRTQIQQAGIKLQFSSLEDLKVRDRIQVSNNGFLLASFRSYQYIPPELSAIGELNEQQLFILETLVNYFAYHFPFLEEIPFFSALSMLSIDSITPPYIPSECRALLIPFYRVKQTELRQRFIDKTVEYIYQNQIPFDTVEQALSLIIRYESSAGLFIEFYENLPPYWKIFFDSIINTIDTLGEKDLDRRDELYNLIALSLEAVSAELNAARDLKGYFTDANYPRRARLGSIFPCLENLKVADRIRITHQGEAIFMSHFKRTIPVELMSDFSRLNEEQLFVFEALTACLAKRLPEMAQDATFTFLAKLRAEDYTPKIIAPGCRAVYLAIYPPRREQMLHEYTTRQESYLTPPTSAQEQAEFLLRLYALGSRNLTGEGENAAEWRMAAQASTAIHNLLVQLREHEGGPIIEILNDFLRPFREAMGKITAAGQLLRTETIMKSFLDREEGLQVLQRTAHIVTVLYLSKHADELLVVNTEDHVESFDDPVAASIFGASLDSKTMSARSALSTFGSELQKERPMLDPELMNYSLVKDITEIHFFIDALACVTGINLTTLVATLPKIEDWEPSKFLDEKKGGLSPNNSPIMNATNLAQAVEELLITDHINDLIRFAFFFMMLSNVIDNNPLKYISGRVFPEVRLPKPNSIDAQNLLLREGKAVGDSSPDEDEENDHAGRADAIIIPADTQIDSTQPANLDNILKWAGEKRIILLETKVFLSSHRHFSLPRSPRRKDIEQVNREIKTIRSNFPKANITMVYFLYVTLEGQKLIKAYIDPKTGLLPLPPKPKHHHKEP